MAQPAPSACVDVVVASGQVAVLLRRLHTLELDLVPREKAPAILRAIGAAQPMLHRVVLASEFRVWRSCRRHAFSLRTIGLSGTYE